MLEVADSGVGIPEDELPRLFERFHRVSGAEGRSHEGSGIGLALVHELVRLHGGEVSVASEIGEGSTFRIELPLRPRHLRRARGHADPGGRTAQRDGLRRGGAPLGRQRDAPIELPAADDDAAGGARRRRQRRPAHVPDARCSSPTTSCAPRVDGADALGQIAERPPDLVLTDVMMPRLDGFELLAALRADPRTRRLPVIVLSARAGEEATVEGLDAGADDYLVKPFSGPELLARVHANLEVTRLRDALASGERERAREMEDVALTLQRSLLPRALPDVLGTELCGRYVPASESLEIGGDFYDATALGDGRLVVTIGDVAGHGVLAAAVMGQVRQAVRAYAFEGHPPAGLMDRLDLLVSDSGLAMTTCLCGIFDPATGELRSPTPGTRRRSCGARDGTVERVDGGAQPPARRDDGPPPRRGRAAARARRGAAALHGRARGAPRRDHRRRHRPARRPAGGGLLERRGGLRADRRRRSRTTCPTTSRCSPSRRTPMAGERSTPSCTRTRTGSRSSAAGSTAWLAAHGATREEANDIVLATHEAAMNAIEHAYGPGDAEITVSAVRARRTRSRSRSTTRAAGATSRSEHRGRGRSIMSALMDDVSVDTGPTGSTVRLRRRLDDPGAE